MRILFVAQAVSIHTARWIRQLADQDWDLHLFDMLGSFPHAELRGVTEYSLLHARWIPLSASPPAYGPAFFLKRGWDPFPLSLLGFFLRRVFPRRSKHLADLITKIQPDIIHSFELQTESYHVLRALEALNGRAKAPWIVTTWGSDIFYFQQFPEHLQMIKAIMSRCDYLIPDCNRDQVLAQNYGFTGQVPLILPGSGGYPIDDMRQLIQPGPVSGRRVITLKGYQGWAGRANDALDAFALCADLLHSYQILVHSASATVMRRVQELKSRTGLNIDILPRSPHNTMLRLFGRSRIAVGVNVTDGVPNAMLEAMTMGAFPIQSDTESTAEWITHGENGLLVEPGNVGQIAEALRRALMDDALVERAAERNLAQLRTRIDSAIIKPRVIDMYKTIAAGGHRERR